MAEVLKTPPTPDGTYQSSGLRRSHPSSNSLFLGASSLPTPTIDTSFSAAAVEHKERISNSPPSSLSSSPQSNRTEFESLVSPTSTPASSATSLEQRYGSSDDGQDMEFPDYGAVQFYHQSEPFEESQSSDEPVESTTTDTTRSDSPILTPTVADDTAIKAEPKQHVDYLSHEWREEDIWSSWRHIVSQRRVYGQRSRLENASWRTWAKSKYSLRTVSPETLNWLKESDVTWLYGPLKPAESHPITAHRSEPASQLSKSSSFVSKKPILKKRSMSEVMLQQSITTSSLLKQAAASVQAQQGKPRNPFLRAGSDVTTSRLTLDTPSRDQLDYFASRSSSSDSATPSEGAAKRHIRFDEKVEQCIAVDNKDDGFENSDNESEDEQHHHSSSDDSSDEGLVMMKRKKRPSRKRAGSLRSKNRRSGSCGAKSCRKTIETLPATTLKYRTDSPETADQAQQHHTFGRNWSPHTLSPSPSSETLRPTHPSRNFLINNDERDCEGEAEPSTWSFGASNPKSSLGSASPTTEMEQTTWSKPSSNRGPAAGGGGSSSHRSPMPGPARMRSVSEPGVGEEYSFGGGMSSGSLRRTPSGMLMPYADGEDEDDLMAIGLFGRVSETINTAKDIAHVIWNVGWRK